MCRHFFRKSFNICQTWKITQIMCTTCFTIFVYLRSLSLPKIAREYNKIQIEDISFKEFVMALKNQEGRKIVANYGLDPKLLFFHIHRHHLL